MPNKQHKQFGVLDIFPMMHADLSKMSFAHPTGDSTLPKLMFATGGKKQPSLVFSIDTDIHSVLATYTSAQDDEIADPFSYILSVTYKNMLQNFHRDLLSPTANKLETKINKTIKNFRDNAALEDVAHLDAILKQAFNLRV